MKAEDDQQIKTDNKKISISYEEFARVIDTDNHVKEIEKITEQLKESEYPYDLLKRRAELNLDLDLLDKAKEDNELCLNLNQDDDEVYFVAYKIAFIEKDFFKGFDHLNKAIDIKPMEAKYYSARGYLKIVVFNHVKDGLEDIDMALKLEPNFPMAHLIRGNTYYYNKGQLNEAIQEYEEGLKSIERLFNAFPQEEIKKDTSVTDYHFYDQFYIQLAKVYSEKGNFEKSIENINIAINLSKNIDLSYFYRAQIYQNYNQPQKAINDYSFLIKEFPDRLGPYLLRGDLYVDQGEFIFAIDDYSKGIELLEKLPNEDSDPNDYLLYINRGNCYIAIKRIKEAIIDFNKSLEMKQDNFQAYMNLGLCFEKLKENEKALDYYTKALEIKPDYNLGLMNRAIFLTDKLLDFQSAIKDLEKLKQLNPKEIPKAEYYLMYNYFKISQFSKARVIAEALSTKVVDNAEYHYIYSKILENFGEHSEAKKQMDKAIKLDPSYQNKSNKSNFWIWFIILIMISTFLKLIF